MGLGAVLQVEIGSTGSKQTQTVSIFFLNFLVAFFFTHKKIRYYKLQAIFLSFTWPCMQNKQERICDLTVDKFLGRKNAMMPIGFQQAFQHASSTSCPEENRMTVLLNF